MGESATPKTGIERPFELKVVVFLELVVAVRYLTYAIAFLTLPPSAMDYSWLTYVFLTLLSVLIAYGLWRFAKWAWLVAVGLSVLGLVSTIPLLAMVGFSMETLTRYLPSIAVDLLVVFILLRNPVKNLFLRSRSAQAEPPPPAKLQNT